MDFSVLMSVYAKEKPEYLKRSIESIYRQTLPPPEVVLMEDGALTEDLYRVIEEAKLRHPSFKVFTLKENCGLGHALNEGLRHCTYDLVARMDSDDICKPNRFEKQISLFERDPKLDICSASIEEFRDEVSHVVCEKKLPEKHEDIVRYARKRCPINHPACVYKKQKVMDAGGYIGFPEDYYLWVRMIMNGCKFYNIQESLLWFRSSNSVYQRRGGWKYARKEMYFQYLFYKIGFISFPRFILNCLIRATVRIVPNKFRAYIYKNFIRHQQI